MVKDMDKAIAFYQSIGLTVKNRWGNNYAMLTAPGVTIGLHPTEEASTGSGTVSVGFMINDVSEARILLKKNSIVYKEEEGKSGHYLHFKGPDGTILYYVKAGW
jgi:catechol 2,3-dioxygenase-like lactoylglutathione lyase family enzyme